MAAQGGWAQVSGLQGCSVVFCSGIVLMEELCYLAVLSLQSEAQEGRGQHSAAQVHAAPEDAAPRGPAGGGSGAGGGICEMGLGLGGCRGQPCAAEGCHAPWKALQALHGAVLLAEGGLTP